jgi:hypothetical protein
MDGDAAAKLTVGLAASFCAAGYSLIAMWYVWPKVSAMPVEKALIPFLIGHIFRATSLLLLAPGVVTLRTLPRQFAVGTASGDVLAATLAIVSLALLRNGWRGALLVVWIFNVAGVIDAGRNVIVGVQLSVIPHLGASVIALVVLVPMLFISHLIVFLLLIRAKSPTVASRA